jgi:hypothetical protein
VYGALRGAVNGLNAAIGEEATTSAGQLCTGTCASSCFVAGTMVAAASGEKPIERIHVGQRVQSTGDNVNGPTEVDPRTWRRLRLTMRPEGDVVAIELLRPLAWVEDVGAAVGATIDLRLEELKIEGEALVEEIDACPQIEDGPGRVVTATLSHLNGDLHELEFEETKEKLQPTGTHRFWSVDRGGWTTTGELVVGERLQAAGGVATVKVNRRVPGMHRVYNIEVEKEHTYFVGAAEVLTHNTCPLDWSLVPTKGKYAGQTRAEHVALHELDNPAKNTHGVFFGNAVSIVNEAWSTAQKAGLRAGPNGILTVPMDRQVGILGGMAGSEAYVPLNRVEIVLVPGTNKLITAYPTH